MTIKVKQVDYGQWLLVAVTGDTPRVLFTSSTFEFPKQKGSYEEMSLVLQTRPETLISMEFVNFANVDRFYTLLRSPLTFKIDFLKK